MNRELLLKNICPYPFSIGGKLYDGTIKHQLKYCRSKCVSRDCTGFVTSSPGHRLCSKGLSCYVVPIDKESSFVINGLLPSGQARTFSRDQREAYKVNAVSEEEVKYVISNLTESFSTIKTAIEEGARDAVGFLHDIRTSVGIVLGWSQTIISRTPGTTFEQKLNAVDNDNQNLFRSINLLKEQLDFADIIANPAAITYGPRRPSSLVGFLYKMVKLFEPLAQRRNCELKFVGGDDRTIDSYNSFQFIPLILLDNAIKYSFRKRSIYVSAYSHDDFIVVRVSSYGDSVPPEYRDSIFNKNVRAPNAVSANPDGMGLGLYLARLIAHAHGYQIKYIPPNPDVAVGNNDFVVEIPLPH